MMRRRWRADGRGQTQRRAASVRLVRRRIGLALTLGATLWVGGTAGAGAQTSRGGGASTAATVATTADTGTTMYDVGGVRVIHRMAAGDIVVANLYLLGGVRQLTFENAGIELLLLEASERGTRAYPRDRLRRQMSRLGTGIVTGANRDWTTFGIRATRATFDSTWAIFASRLMHPTLDSLQVELVRQQFLLAVRQRQDSPDALVEYLADSVGFAGHPYAIEPAGTERSIAAIKLADLRAYHAAQVVKSRMLLVVVGDVPRAKVEGMVGQTLARLPAGDYTWTLPDTVPRRKASALVVDRQLPTNYILGRYAGPKAGTADYYALRVTTAVLSGQLFGEIRSRRNLTYAVDAPFEEQAVAAGGLYVSTVQPELTIDVMRQQLAAVRTGTIDPEALGRLVQQFLTQFYLENESNTDQADFLARAWLFEGDWRAIDRFEERLRAVTPGDIQRVAQRYIRDVQWAFVGDAKKAPVRSFERF